MRCAAHALEMPSETAMARTAATNSGRREAGGAAWPVSARLPTPITSAAKQAAKTVKDNAPSAKTLLGRGAKKPAAASGKSAPKKAATAKATPLKSAKKPAPKPPAKAPVKTAARSGAKAAAPKKSASASAPSGGAKKAGASTGGKAKGAAARRR